jgi:hypothetical protein
LLRLEGNFISRQQLEVINDLLKPDSIKLRVCIAKVKSGAATADEVLFALSGAFRWGWFDAAVALIKTTEWRKNLEDKMADELTKHTGTVLVSGKFSGKFACSNVDLVDASEDVCTPNQLTHTVPPPFFGGGGHLFTANRKTPWSTGRVSSRRLLGT